MGILGFVILAYMAGIWTLGEPIGTRPLLTLGVLLTLGSVQMVLLGLLGELLVKTTIQNSEIFSIRRETGATGLPDGEAPRPLDDPDGRSSSP